MTAVDYYAAEQRAILADDDFIDLGPLQPSPPSTSAAHRGHGGGHIGGGHHPAPHFVSDSYPSFSGGGRYSPDVHHHQYSSRRVDSPPATPPPPIRLARAVPELAPPPLPLSSSHVLPSHRQSPSSSVHASVVRTPPQRPSERGYNILTGAPAAAAVGTSLSTARSRGRAAAGGGQEEPVGVRFPSRSLPGGSSQTHTSTGGTFSGVSGGAAGGIVPDAEYRRVITELDAATVRLMEQEHAIQTMEMDTAKLRAALDQTRDDLKAEQVQTQQTAERLQRDGSQRVAEEAARLGRQHQQDREQWEATVADLQQQLREAQDTVRELRRTEKDLQERLHFLAVAAPAAGTLPSPRQQAAGGPSQLEREAVGVPASRRAASPLVTKGAWPPLTTAQAQQQATSSHVYTPPRPVAPPPQLHTSPDRALPLRPIPLGTGEQAAASRYATATYASHNVSFESTTSTPVRARPQPYLPHRHQHESAPNSPEHTADANDRFGGHASSRGGYVDSASTSASKLFSMDDIKGLAEILLSAQRTNPVPSSPPTATTARPTSPPRTYRTSAGAAPRNAPPPSTANTYMQRQTGSTATQRNTTGPPTVSSSSDVAAPPSAPPPPAANTFGKRSDPNRASVDYQLVSFLEEQLLQACKQRDDVEGQFAKMENMRIRTVADKAKKDSLQVLLRELNTEVSDIRMELRRHSVLER